MRVFFLFFLFAACAAGPRDVLDGNGGHDVRDAAPPPSGYAYVARRAVVSVGLVEAPGFSDDDAHAVIDRIADSANACFKKSAALKPGAVRLTLPVDDGGIAGAPDVTFSPPEAATIGLLCILAPIRMSTFAPRTADAGARSITLESAWGSP